MPLHFDLRSDVGTLSESDRLELSAEDILSLMARFDKLGTWRFDVAAGTCRLSGSCREIYGFPADDEAISIAAYRDRIHPDDLPVFKEAFVTTIERKSSFMTTYRVGNAQAYRFVRSIGLFRERADGAGEVVGVTMVVGEQVRQLVLGA